MRLIVIRNETLVRDIVARETDNRTECDTNLTVCVCVSSSDVVTVESVDTVSECVEVGDNGAVVDIDIESSSRVSLEEGVELRDSVADIEFNPCETLRVSDAEVVTEPLNAGLAESDDENTP